MTLWTLSRSEHHSIESKKIYLPCKLLIQVGQRRQSSMEGKLTSCPLSSSLIALLSFSSSLPPDNWPLVAIWTDLILDYINWWWNYKLCNSYKKTEARVKGLVTDAVYRKSGIKDWIDRWIWCQLNNFIISFRRPAGIQSCPPAKHNARVTHQLYYWLLESRHCQYLVSKAHLDRLALFGRRQVGLIHETLVKPF